MNKLTIALASAASLAIVACAEEPAENVAYEDAATADQMANADAAPGTLVEVAQGDESFSTLVSAVTAAGLGETLSGDGPFTVFAPTNDAFAKIPEATLTELTTNDTETLGTILTYHVVPGKVMSSDLTDGMKAATVQGAELTVDIDGGAMVDEAKVIQADIEAANGIIHVIDKVIMPGS